MLIINSLTKRFNNIGFKKYFFNTGWVLIEKVFRIISSLFVGVWVARYLGPSQFGLFSYSLSFVALFTALSNLGLDEIVVRELVKNKIRRDEIIISSFLLKLFASTFVFVLLIVLVNLFSNDSLTNSLVLIVAFSTIFQSFNVIDFYFQSIVVSKYVTLANLLSLAAGSLIKVLLIINEASLIQFAWVVLFESIVLALGYVYYFFLKYPENFLKFFKFNSSIAVKLFRDSWPLILSGVVISLAMKIDQVMIKEMLGSYEVGQYAAAVRLSESWYFIPLAISSSFFPAIVNSKIQSLNLYYTRLKKLFALLFWLSVSISIFVTLFSNQIVSFLFGSDFKEAANVLIIHIWGSLAVSFGVVWSRWIVSENKQKLVVIFHLFSVILNVLLNFYLIPTKGIIGAGIATALSNLIAQFFGILFYKPNITKMFIFYLLFPFKIKIK